MQADPTPWGQTSRSCSSPNWAASAEVRPARTAAPSMPGCSHELPAHRSALPCLCSPVAPPGRSSCQSAPRPGPGSGWSAPAARPAAAGRRREKEGRATGLGGLAADFLVVAASAQLRPAARYGAFAATCMHFIICYMLDPVLMQGSIVDTCMPPRLARARHGPLAAAYPFPAPPSAPHLSHAVHVLPHRLQLLLNRLLTRHILHGTQAGGWHEAP